MRGGSKMEERSGQVSGSEGYGVWGGGEGQEEKEEKKEASVGHVNGQEMNENEWA